jgi:hypothetical protein
MMLVLLGGEQISASHAALPMHMVLMLRMAAVWSRSLPDVAELRQKEIVTLKLGLLGLPSH